MQSEHPCLLGPVWTCVLWGMLCPSLGYGWERLRTMVLLISAVAAGGEQ